MVNKSQMEMLQKQINGGESKANFQQPNSYENKINLNEFLGKRLSISGQSGSASNINTQS